MLLIAAALFLFPKITFAQSSLINIAHVQPDALGPGMTIAMEILAPAKDSGAFGTDGVYWYTQKIILLVITLFVIRNS